MSSPYPQTSYIMQNISVPSVNPRTMCILGQSNVSGVAGYYTGLENYSIPQIEALFGATQHITRLLKEALYNISQQVVKPQLHAYVKADNGSGVAAVKKVTATGTATATGTYSIKLLSNSGANTINVSYDVASGASVTTITAARAAAIAAATNSPFTTGAALGVLTLTAVNKGTQANDIPIYVEPIPGVADVITLDTTGATNPDFSDIVTNTTVLNSKIDYFVSLVGYTAANTAIKALLLDRSNNINQTNNQDFNGVLMFGNILDPITDAATLAATTNYEQATNGLNVVPVFNKEIDPTAQYNGGFIFCAPDELTVNVAVADAIKLTAGTNTSLYLVNQSTGRPANAKIPMHNTTLPYAATTLFANYAWTYADINIMQQYHFGLVTSNGTYSIIGNLYTLSNVAQYVKYENRWQFFICREFIASETDDFLAQKLWNNGTAVDANETDRQGMIGFFSNLYQILNGLVQDSIFLNYYAGIVDNSAGNYSNFISVLEKTLTFQTLIVSNLPKGVMSASLFLTPTMQIDNLQITQQNNLISA